MTGKFIVFEGGEGAGKTTQIKALHIWLRENIAIRRLLAEGVISNVMCTREPGGTLFGNEIRHLLLNRSSDVSENAITPHTELLLYAADRAQHVHECLIPQLREGTIILCDRYTDSTIAYQGYGRGLDLDMIHTLNEVATGGLHSDLTFWLDMDAEVGLARTRQRGEVDRMEKNDLAFHKNVRRGFQALALEFPHRIVRINANQDAQSVSHDIQRVFREKLEDWYGKLHLE